MGVLLNDQIRTALIVFANSVFPVLTIFGVASFTAEQTATIMLMVTSAVTLLALVFKQGAQGDPNTTIPIATSNEAVKQALNTPAPSYEIVDPKDVKDIIDEYERVRAARGRGATA